MDSAPFHDMDDLSWPPNIDKENKHAISLELAETSAGIILNTIYNERAFFAIFAAVIPIKNLQIERINIEITARRLRVSPPTPGEIFGQIYLRMSWNSKGAPNYFRFVKKNANFSAWASNSAHLHTPVPDILNAAEFDQPIAQVALSIDFFSSHHQNCPLRRPSGQHSLEVLSEIASMPRFDEF